MTSAWTLRRDLCVVFIGLPFAGLADFLERAAEPGGPPRRAGDADPRIELRPVVMPIALERQTQSLSGSDAERATRSFWGFAALGQRSREPARDTIGSALDLGDGAAESRLQAAEALSASPAESHRTLSRLTSQTRNWRRVPNMSMSRWPLSAGAVGQT